MDIKQKLNELDEAIIHLIKRRLDYATTDPTGYKEYLNEQIEHTKELAEKRDIPDYIVECALQGLNKLTYSHQYINGIAEFVKQPLPLDD